MGRSGAGWNEMERKGREDEMIQIDMRLFDSIYTIRYNTTPYDTVQYNTI